MSKALLFASLLAAVAQAQSIDYHLFVGDGCDGLGISCLGVQDNVCCNQPDISNGIEGVNLFTSASTDTWRDIADGTLAVSTSLQGGDPCGVELARLAENNCFDRQSQTISGGFFRNGQSDPQLKREIRKCSSTQEIDAYIMKRGGVVYSVSARNVTHVAALKAAESSAELEDYIIANHETKEAAKALRKVTGSN